MMWLLFLLGGVLCGWRVHHYVEHFADNLNREVYTAYTEIYPQNPLHFMAESILKPLKRHFSARLYRLLFALLFIICYATNEPLQALCFALYGTLLIAISLVDWHYRLISPALCQALFALGLGAAYWQIGALTLAQSLQSAVIFFGVFYAIYHAAKWYYRQEALGRGDYWLALGLGVFLPAHQLPVFLFLACFFGLLYAAYAKYRHRAPNAVPFGPFMSLAGVVCLLLN
ncbi:prepilin peptidase [Aggregatibacter actinomycetemcomitans]|uniref:prepilin peptidase n=1 Tax=Aggregatibacter actinomycetemcomitans TaxID=714 RepID=UPI0002F01D8A|nr:A24 family peptidase [Aggregatibacter actinomycetemcomitans]KNE78032.1 peptidase A24 [Aggregatibacter actinomycetemcomitans RhAA1]MBN6080144.1 prepilin peptidase [Aggregatibacter actinomycetemcomitans]